MTLAVDRISAVINHLNEANAVLSDLLGRARDLSASTQTTFVERTLELVDIMIAQGVAALERGRREWKDPILLVGYVRGASRVARVNLESLLALPSACDLHEDIAKLISLIRAASEEPEQKTIEMEAIQ